MFALALATLALQLPASPARDTVPRAPAPASASDSAADTTEHRHRPPPRRVPVTAALDQSAFGNATARDLLGRARVARMAQDSALRAYDAKAYQRVSVGMGVSRFARDRLLFRTENASRVRWQRGTGAWVELTGQRTVLPAFKEADTDVDMDDLSPVPYFPGRESLWFPSSDWSVARAEVNDREMVHPLATGAEAYYRYATGGSATLRLPGGRALQLRELRITARRPDWKLFVGSFWFDAGSGQLVRAAYRMSAEMDIWKVAEEESTEERVDRRARRDSIMAARDSARGRTRPRRERDGDDDDEVPGWVKATMSPMRATISAITVEYGLYEGRFWMPRSHFAEGIAQAGFMRLPVKVEERFNYASVNGADPLPPLPVDSAAARQPAGRVAVNVGGRPPAADSARRPSARERQCAAGGSYVRRATRPGGLVVGVRVPCDTAALAHSADLPGSIYDPGEELFGDEQRGELMRTLEGLQPGWGPQRPVVHYGADLARYNRVEALSLGVSARQDLGRGITADALARLGVGDWQPNGEVGLARSDGRRTVRAAAFRRLGAANDWGAPLGLGASVGALLYGRDEGFYYRTWGAELARAPLGPQGLSWRLFAERQSDARVETSFALAKGLANGRVYENIDARNGTIAGVSGEWRLSRGVDPSGLRTLASLRAEAGAGTFDYTRGAADVTVSRALGGALAGAVTVGAGTSGGALPPQRAWYLGSASTVRGERAGPNDGGNSYWLGRAELGLDRTGVRPSVFYDLGWAGDRDDFANPGRPVSGFGAGASFMDGLVRFDVAKGVWPKKSMRGYLYLEARF